MAEKGKEKILDDEMDDGVTLLSMEMEKTNKALSTVMDILEDHCKYPNKVQDLKVAIERLKKRQEDVKNRIVVLLNSDSQSEEITMVAKLSDAVSILLCRLEDLNGEFDALMDLVEKSGKYPNEIPELLRIIEQMMKDQEMVKIRILELTEDDAIVPHLSITKPNRR